MLYTMMIVFLALMLALALALTVWRKRRAVRQEAAWADLEAAIGNPIFQTALKQWEKTWAAEEAARRAAEEEDI